MASRFLVPLGRQGGDPLFSIYREMNRMFDDVLGGPPATGAQGGRMAMPSLDVQEKEDELCVAVELPGVRSEDVDVRLERDVLTISGEKKAEQDPQQANYHVMERSYGRFSRSLQLPFTPDPEQVSADYEHGVLKVRLKRAPQQQGSRRIQVRSGASSGAQLGQQGSERPGGQSYAQGQGQGQGGQGGQGAPGAQSSAAGASGGMEGTGGAGDGGGSQGSKGAGQRGGQSTGSAGRA